MELTYSAEINKITKRDIAGAPSGLSVTLRSRPSVKWTPADVVEESLQCGYDAVSDIVWSDSRELLEPEKGAILTELQMHRDREFRGDQ